MLNQCKHIYLKNKMIVNYIIFGGATTFVNWIVYGLMVGVFETSMNVGNVVAWFVAVVFAYVTNKIWVFESVDWSIPIIMKEGASFFGSRIISGAFEIGMFPVLVHLGMEQRLFGIDGFLAKILLSVVVIVLNYIFSRWFVFGGRGKGFFAVVQAFDRKSERNKNIVYYTVYTLIFLFTAAVVFLWFWWNDKTFIWHYDGFWQHNNTLAYYGMYLRNIVRTLFTTGRLHIPMWDFSIGYGADIFTTLHYYVIGDPLTFFSIFVPTAKTELLYNFLIILRLFLAGISFSMYCREMKKGRFATLCGAIVYVFCSYALYLGIRHPFFLNPMMYLPLILLGVEKIFAGKRPYLFMMMVCLSLTSNFYFFYMLSVMIFLYGVVRFLFLFPEKRLRNLAVFLSRFIGYYVVGILMASVIFLPVLMRFVSTERANISTVVQLLYPTGYYPLLFHSFITGRSAGFSTLIGTSPITLAAVVLLFTRRKKNTQLKIGFLLLSFFLLTPVIGYVLNGFSYATNRWVFGYAFLVALILVEMVPNMLAATKKQLFVVSTFACVSISIYLTIYLLVNVSRTREFFASFSIFLLTLLFMYWMKRHGFRKKRIVSQLILMTIIISGIIVNAGYRFSPNEGNYIDEFLVHGEAYERYMSSSAAVVRDIADNASFFRYEENISGGQKTIRNAALLNQVNSTAFYYSLSNGYIANFLQEIGFLSRDYQFSGLDNRAFPGVLASNKYYVVAPGLQQYLPYGYNELVLASESFEVYKNDTALPLGYTYSTIINRSDFAQMSFIERQQALLQGAILEENITSLESIQSTFNHREIPYEIEVDDGVGYQDGKLIVNDVSAAVTLRFEGVENSEMYLNFENIHFTPEPSLDILSEESEGEGSPFQDMLYHHVPGPDTGTIVAKSGNVSKRIQLRTPAYNWYRGQHDFIVNLGYSEAARTEITLTFKEVGTYTFDGIDVICQPMDEFIQQVEGLKADVLENVRVDTNTVSGTIDLEESKLLALSIPYDEGWSAYINGEEAELLHVNGMYMGVYLDSGNHEVLLRYVTPGLRIGATMSLLGAFLFLGIVVFRMKIAKKRV